MWKRLRHLQHVEWSWSLTILVVGAVSSFSLPAWAVHVAGLFVEYSPLSWVIAGFAGLTVWAVSYALIAWGRRVFIKTRYDAELIRKTGYIDPLAQSFEKKRIYIHDFVLPSNPFIENKTFIECELIGPAILLMDERNHVNDLALPKVDGIVLPDDAGPWNMIILRGCTFRKCRFIRLTMAVRDRDFSAFNDPTYVNWVTHHPGRQMSLGLQQQQPGPTLQPPAPTPAIENQDAKEPEAGTQGRS